MQINYYKFQKYVILFWPIFDPHPLPNPQVAFGDTGVDIVQKFAKNVM